MARSFIDPAFISKVKVVYHLAGSNLVTLLIEHPEQKIHRSRKQITTTLGGGGISMCMLALFMKLMSFLRPGIGKQHGINSFVSEYNYQRMTADYE